MRVRPEDLKNLIEVLEGYLKFVDADFYLFGSRTRDSSKGGDIDLLLLVSDSQLDALNSLKGLILVQFKKKLGERKIDLVIDSKASPSSFTQMVLLGAVLIKSWR